MASLAETLYATWQRSWSSEPVWGNLGAECREVWERVAEVARVETKAEAARLEAKSRAPNYCPGCGRDVNPRNQHERDSSQACVCAGDDLCKCGHERDDHPRGICWTVNCKCQAFELKERAP